MKDRSPPLARRVTWVLATEPSDDVLRVLVDLEWAVGRGVERALDTDFLWISPLDPDQV